MKRGFLSVEVVQGLKYAMFDLLADGGEASKEMDAANREISTLPC